MKTKHSVRHLGGGQNFDTNTAVRIKNISKTYPGNSQKAVDGLSLEIADGEVFTLLGPSGCGKSTTLRMVAGLETPDEGEIYFGTKAVAIAEKRFSLPAEKRNVGMVFQSYAIWPHMTVEQNVAFPLKSRRFRRSEINRRVSEVLELVGMSGMENRPGPLLSGGQQQRVAFARALVTEPRVLLLDEPFSNLDTKLREQMRIEMKLLQKRLNIAVLFVTHDQVEALNLSDRIAVMDSGEIQQIGSPKDLYEQPANEFVRDFLGQSLLLKGRIKEIRAAGNVAISIDGAEACVVIGSIPSRNDMNIAEAVIVGVRPEDVEISAAASGEAPPGMLAGTAHAALYSGERIEYQVKIEGQGVVTVYGDRRKPVPEGERIWVKIRGDGHTAWPSARQK